MEIIEKVNGLDREEVINEDDSGDENESDDEVEL